MIQHQSSPTNIAKQIWGLLLTLTTGFGSYKEFNIEFRSGSGEVNVNPSWTSLNFIPNSILGA